MIAALIQVGGADRPARREPGRRDDDRAAVPAARLQRRVDSAASLLHCDHRLKRSDAW